MSKITKKMFEDYKSTEKKVKNSQNKHQKNINKIIEVVKPLISKNFKGRNLKIAEIEFCNDSYIDYEKKSGEQYEWIEISEDEYYKIYDKIRWNKNKKYEDYLKTEYTPEYDEKYYKRIEKRYEYLRVYFYEWWRYGGEDHLEYDFLLSEIMDETYLKKDKLKKLEDLS